MPRHYAASRMPMTSVRRYLFFISENFAADRRHDATEQHDATARKEDLGASRYQLSDQNRYRRGVRQSALSQRSIFESSNITILPRQKQF
jgi:hypothetical protein